MNDFYESKFYKGWRPALGWVIVGGVSLTYIVIPVVKLALYIGGRSADFMPTASTSDLVSLVSLALGAIAVRTHEKINSKD